MTTATPLTTTQSQPSDAAVSVSQARRAAVAQALADIRQLAGGKPDRSVLAMIAERLEQLAAQRALFPRAEFPPSAGGVGASTRYRLNAQDSDTDIALYLNSINPGKTTIPHNHDTWAVIVAIEGQEDNRVYRRTDDGSNPAKATLALEREVSVQPGTHIAFLAEDLHSIHVVGSAPTLHFHLYGQPLETLAGRIGVQLDTGNIVNYNATQMQASQVAA
jgi:predicted metal-dependent enzyme (double-stranded beta helix superfamily)